MSNNMIIHGTLAVSVEAPIYKGTCVVMLVDVPLKGNF